MPEKQPTNSSARRRSGRRERRVSIRSELRKNPDLHKIAGAVVAMAIAQAEKEAEEQRRREQEQAEQESDRA